MPVGRKWLRLGRTVSVLAVFLLISAYLSHKFDQHDHSGNLNAAPNNDNYSESVTIGNGPIERDIYRNANESSTFWLTYNKLEQIRSDIGHYDSFVVSLLPSVVWSDKTLKEEKRLLKGWSNKNPEKRRLNRCKLLVSGMYQLNANWTNMDAYQPLYSPYEDLDNAVLLTERMRIYNYCFLNGGLNSLDVFRSEYLKENNFTAWDYQYRMFPFLNKSFDYENEIMWPKVVDMFSDDFPVTVNTEIPDLKVSLSPMEFNVNFMSSFIKFSRGRGIVTTMSSEGIKLFDKQLQVLDMLNNTLPIQVVSTGRELDQDYYIRLSNAVKNSKQKVYLINLSRFLDQDFCRKFVTGFFHKWFATLFNTFEEELFLDVDAVPLKSPVDFFNITAYNKSGTYFYRDRVWGGRHHRVCNSLLVDLRPTYEERKLLGTKLFLEDHDFANDSEIDLRPDAAAKIYDNFFNKKFMHSIDSGLMVIHKAKKFAGILQGLSMHIIPVFSTCSYGDKEFYWLGQFFMGEDFTIDPYGGGVAGPIQKTYDKKKRTRVFTVCGGQIAHCDDENKISWVNGGITLCKSQKYADKDIKKGFNQYFPDVRDTKELSILYNEVPLFEGLIIPRTKKWKAYKNCGMRIFCAKYEVRDRIPYRPYENKLVKIDPQDVEFYKKIGETWKKAGR